MRADQQAAIKAYLTARKESDRLAMAGGATKPTKTLLATTGGFYLDVKMNTLGIFKERGWRADRPVTTSVVAERRVEPRQPRSHRLRGRQQGEAPQQEGQGGFQGPRPSLRPDPHRHQEERRLEDHGR